MNIDDAVLVVVDVQGKLASLMFEPERMLNNIERTIRIAQILNVPILWTEQAPEKIGNTIEPVRQLLFPALKPIHKREFSCYLNPQFRQHIDALNRRQVLLVGMEAHVCLFQTARDLKRHGYDVHVVADAVSSRTQMNKEIALNKMASAGISIISAEMLGCDLMVTADHPQFREVMANIKRLRRVTKPVHTEVDDLFQETREFDPPQVFKSLANIKNNDLYVLAHKDRVIFWEECARRLDWFKPWDKALFWNKPFAQWFVGGKINASYNCLDRHIKANLGKKLALIWEGENGDERKLTYEDVYLEVNKLANALKALSVHKGDRVAIYLPMVPEAIFAMLACARIGAVHTVVFGGFSAESLRDRINDAAAKLLITADGGYRRGAVVQLKAVADAALSQTPSIQNVLVLKRTGQDISMKSGRDHWYHDAIRNVPLYCEPEPMDSEDILFILYTSGTTGKPKGIVHSTGGYMTGVCNTTHWVFDLKPNDVFWCTADVGWVTGHSYVAYGPMSNAATQVIYEGAPDFPERNRFWKLIEKYKVSIFYTAPTAIRAFMKWGTEWPKGCDLSSLRLLGSVGEPINPEAWIWYYEEIGRKRCPIVDTWWQTETGAIMITTLPGVSSMKPGSAGHPLPGIDAEILNEEGQVIPHGGGFLSILSPWPSMLRGIWGDESRYKETYWGKWQGKSYFAGDGTKRDRQGYFWFLGRVDDIMLVAGHNISTAEVESALVDNHKVAEAAVVGVKDDIKGQAIAAFVILKEGNKPSKEVEELLKDHVAQKIGAIARPSKIIFTADVPKTRSGKIMRRLLKDVAEGRTLGDVTTLADPAVVAALKEKYEEN